MAMTEDYFIFTLPRAWLRFSKASAGRKPQGARGTSAEPFGVPQHIGIMLGY